MPLPLLTPWLLVLSTLPPNPATARVSIDLATLHVATLTPSRGTGDHSDSPYLLISILSPRARTGMHLPAMGHWLLAENAIVAPTPIQVVDLAPGDSARVVISVLEGESAEAAPETAGLSASTEALARLGHPMVDPAEPTLDTALEGLRRGGNHWIGSVSLLLTNDGGTAYWRRLDCARDCAVLQGLPEGATGAALTKQTNGVVELSGEGGPTTCSSASRRPINRREAPSAGATPGGPAPGVFPCPGTGGGKGHGGLPRSG